MNMSVELSSKRKRTAKQNRRKYETQDENSSSKNNVSDVMGNVSSRRKQSQSAKLRKSGLKSVSKTKNSKAPVAVDTLKTTVNSKKKRRPNAKVLDETLFWDFVEGIVITKDAKFEKKISVGCATIAVDWNSLANNSLQVGLSSESAVKFKVHVNAPALNTSADAHDYDKLYELGSTRAKSSTQLKEKLNFAVNMIDQLKIYIRRLKLENENLHSEKEDLAITNLMHIKQDATDGELPAIILLNKIASYSSQTS